MICDRNIGNNKNSEKKTVTIYIACVVYVGQWFLTNYLQIFRQGFETTAQHMYLDTYNAPEGKIFEQFVIFLCS